MNESPLVNPSRRTFIKRSGQVAAASAFASMAKLSTAYAAENNTIQLALVGVGGRGSGAVRDAMVPENGPVKLVAVADIFPGRMTRADGLINRLGDRADVPPERRFMGLDGYKKAMDCLNPGDVVILTTPPAFRWVHFTYAISRGLNVFMEKPVTVDGPTTRRMIELAAKADEKNLKVGVGLMVRHCRGRQELWKRIQDGEIGELVTLRGNRLQGQTAHFGRPSGDTSEFYHQIRHFHGVLWSGGGLFSDLNIHQIDEMSWMKNAWPVEAIGFGGRHYRGNSIDQNFDSYSVEYTFADGTKMLFNGRYMNGCFNEFASYAHGTKGAAVVSTHMHAPGKVRTYKGHVMTRENLQWAFPQPERSPYEWEWVDLVDAIRNNKPYNEVVRGAEASLVTSMGRMACHTGQRITYEQMLNHEHEFAPGLDTLTEDSPAPLMPDKDGKYPVPQPGITKNREY